MQIAMLCRLVVCEMKVYGQLTCLGCSRTQSLKSHMVIIDILAQGKNHTTMLLTRELQYIKMREDRQDYSSYTS